MSRKKYMLIAALLALFITACVNPVVPSPAPNTPEPALTWQTIQVVEAGVSFRVPEGWASSEQWVWQSPDDPARRLGFRWSAVVAPNIPAAIFLPANAVVLNSEPVDMLWAAGRWYEVEVYSEPTAGQTKAQTRAYEKHIIVTYMRGKEMIGLDFYVGSRTITDVLAMDPILEQIALSAKAELD